MMSTFRVATLSLLLATPALAKAPRGPALPASVASAPQITWLGLDYTFVEMVGMRDFEQPSEIFPGYLHKWNGLVLEEQMDELELAMNRQIVTSVNLTRERNEVVKPNIIREFADDSRAASSRLTDADLAGVAKAYQGAGHGVGLVFVMEELLKEAEVGCMSMTFVDLDQGQLLWSLRTCEAVKGFGFRNYWFNPVKEGIQTLRNVVKHS